MKNLLLLLSVLLLFSCKKDKTNIPSNTVVKVVCFANDIEEGESVSVNITYRLQGENEESSLLEMSVHQGVYNTEVGIGQLVDLESLSLNYETSDQIKIWHKVSNMDETETYEEISPTNLHNTTMQFDYSF